MDDAMLLRELNYRLRRAQRVLAEYLPEDSGKSEKDTIAELLGILDSLRASQATEADQRKASALR